MSVPTPTQEDLDMLKQQVEGVVRRAVSLGIVVTVEQYPLKPLAMGHYLPTISVRAARPKAE